MSEQYREPEAKKTAPFKDEAPVESIVVDKATESKPALVERSDGPMRRPSPRNRDPFVGTTLNDRYHVLSLIGEGATSAVYKAEDTKLNEAVAIKILHSHLAADATIMRRFEQEAKTARLLRHPNIVNVRRYEKTDSDIPYLVMDFVEGTSLHDAIKVDGWLPAERTIEIFIQVCAALATAHEKGIVHRDLKPSNIMLTDAPDGSLLVKVLDFGVAKVLPATGDTVLKLTQTGEMLGSILYMSPEQCLDKDLDGRSDCYSLGCVMYETLTGKPPLSARTAFETMNKHMSEMPEALDRVRPDLKFSPGLQYIIFRAMSKDPEDRYQMIGQFQDDLQKLSDGTVLNLDQFAKTNRDNLVVSDTFAEEISNYRKRVMDFRIKGFLISFAHILALFAVVGLYVWSQSLIVLGISLALFMLAMAVCGFLHIRMGEKEDKIARRARSQIIEKAECVNAYITSINCHIFHDELYPRFWVDIEPQSEGGEMMSLQITSMLMGDPVWENLSKMARRKGFGEQKLLPMPVEVYLAPNKQPVAVAVNGVFAWVIGE